jgi:hypothetical protein
MDERVGLPRVRFWSALVVMLSLAAAGTGWVLAAIGDQRTVDFVRSVALPGAEVPEGALSGGIPAAVGWAIVGVAFGAASVLSRGQVWFALAAIWSLLTLAGALAVLTPANPRLETFPVGPVTVSVTFAGLLQATASVVGIAASVLGWLASVPEPERPVFMPPMQHQC